MEKVSWILVNTLLTNQYDRGVGRKLLPCQTEQDFDLEVNSVHGETP